MLRDALERQYGLDGREPGPASGDWSFAQETMDLIFAELGGTSFGNGLYRVNNAAEAVDATGEANEFLYMFSG